MHQQLVYLIWAGEHSLKLLGLSFTHKEASLPLLEKDKGIK